MNFYVHDLSPIAFSILGLDIPWYWLSYFLSYFIILYCSLSLIEEKELKVGKRTFLSYMFFGFFTMLIFSKLFYVFFYHPSYYLQDLSRVFKVWHGGMSFHGALIGVIVWTYFFSKKIKASFWYFTDIVATYAGIGIFLGRLANFFNGELAGRVSTAPWAMVFPRLYDYNPRHPSQIYQALLEGLLLFIIMNHYKKDIYQRGRQSIRFLFFYGALRFLCEFFREPDKQIGLISHLSMGQIYCLVMMFLSFFLFVRKA